MIVYVSGPYTKGDVIENIRIACDTADKLLEKGHIPYIPHLSAFWHLVSLKSYDEWMRIDAAFIPRCDCLLRIPGESKGGDIEVQIAQRLDIPVYFSIDELIGAYGD